jgi:hypothetical protein
MLAINTTTQSLEVLLASAPTTALKCAVSFGEHTTGAYSAKNQTASISGTSAVTVLSAPASGYERVVRGVSIQNVDSASATITVRLNDNGTYTTLCKVTILAGYLLAYDDDGWYVINDSGARLGVGPTGATGAAGAAGATGPQGPTGPEGGSVTLTTKGDLLSRDTSALARLPVGTNGQYLSADSSTTTGLIWSTPPTGAPAAAQYVTLALDGTLTSERVLTAGTGISITDGGANGNVTVAASGLATNTPTYITLTNTADLTNERALAVSSPITGTDGGAGSTYTIGLNQAAITHNNLGGLTTGDPHTQYLLESTVTTAGDILYGTGASAITRLGVGSTGQVLTVAAGLPSWSTPTTPAPTSASYVTLATDGTLTSERVLTAGSGISITDGGAGTTVTVAASGLATNTPSFVTLAATTDLTNERVLTAGSGISITDGGAGSTVTIAASGLSTNTPQFLTLAATADLTNERVFTAGTGISVTDAGAGSTYTVSVNQGALTHNNLGGLTTGDPHTQYITKATTTTTGDILYASAANTPSRLGIGSTGQVLTVSGGIPAWSTPSSGVTDHGLLTGLADDDHTQYTVVAPGSSTRNVIQPSGDFKPLVVKAASTQTANLFEAQLNAGTVRASIDPNGKVTGYGLDASSQAVTNVLDPVNAQDASTKTYTDTKIPKSTVTTNGDLIYGTGSSTVTRLGIGSTGQVLTVSGGVPTWAASTGGAPSGASYITLATDATLTNERVFTAGTGISVTDGGAGSTYTVAVNEAGLTHNNLGGLTTGDPHTQYITKATTSTTGDLLYASSANTPARLGIGSTGQVLTVSGGLPVWAAATGGVTDHGALTGLADDDHSTVYPALAPSSSTRNVITPTGDFKPLVIKGSASQTANLFEAQLNAGTVRASVDSTGKVTGYGIDASSQKVTNVGTPTVSTDGVNLTYCDAKIPKSTVTTNGDLIYATGSATVTRLGIGTTGQVLTVSGGVPTWAASGGGVSDHGALTGLADDDHANYVFETPGSSTRNVIQPSGDFKALILKANSTQTSNLLEAQLNAGTLRAAIGGDGMITGYGFDSSSRRIMNVADPTSAQDAATKAYADSLVGGAPLGADYIVLSANGTLTNERVLTAGSGISISSTSTTVTIESTGSGTGNEAQGYLLYKFGII